MANKTIAFDIIARDKASSAFGKIAGAAKVLGVAGLGAIVTGSVNTEAAFSKTMNLMQAGTGASGAAMERLRALAIKMGADTQFSANEAGDAMLELAKAGIKPAAIEAGALKGTLTLAAAGQLDMASAAGIAGNALNTFGLKAKDMNAVAAALAGGANASTASVESLGLALQQVGPGAKTAGLSIQETTAVLAAFDNAGIKGSDAGTTLKTMLTRLVPTTEKARNAMKDLGLKFTDAKGEFVSISNISEQLQDKMGKLSDAERTKAMATIFGSDATRAATILMNQGSEGIRKYIKATSDQGAAEKMAAASMKGTSGAIERMKGSLETAALSLGQVLAPAVVAGADAVADLANKAGELAPHLRDVYDFVMNNQTAFIALAAAIAAVVAITKIHAAVLAVQTAGGLLASIRATQIATSAMKAAAAAQWIWTGSTAAGNTVFVLRIRLLAMDAAAWVRSTAATVAHTVATKTAAVATAVSSAATAAYTAVTNALTLSNIRSAAAMAATRAGLVAGAVATKAISAATKAYAAVQWVLNAALSANPIGLVIVAIAALVAGLIIAYKKSETFRTIVHGSLHAVAEAGKWMWNSVLKPAFAALKTAIEAVGRAGIWLWNNALQPTFKFIVGGVAKILAMWATMLRALSEVPGFGWAKGAADALASAAGKAQAFADNINKIPTHKTVNIDIFQNVHTRRTNESGGFGAVGNARGTGFWRGGRTWVGEEGPELVDLPRGSRIYPAAKSRQMAAEAQAESFDYRRLAREIVAAMREGAPLVKLENAGQTAYLRGAY